MYLSYLSNATRKPVIFHKFFDQNSVKCRENFTSMVCLRLMFTNNTHSKNSNVLNNKGKNNEIDIFIPL